VPQRPRLAHLAVLARRRERAITARLLPYAPPALRHAAEDAARDADELLALVAVSDQAAAALERNGATEHVLELINEVKARQAGIDWAALLEGIPN